MNGIYRLLGGIALLSLAGCAAQQGSGQALQQAASDFQKVKEDPDVLRSAPKDVIRAGESLARAERLSSYLGSGSDVSHYAYLSSRYSEIAREHSNLTLSQEQMATMDLERQRLQLALREAKLAVVQQQGKWVEDQIQLATTQSDRGLVMTLGDVLFDQGDAQLKGSANRTMLKIVQYLQLNPRRVVRVEGYTDNTGDRQSNLKLSQDRAQAVADLLADLGVDEKRIQVRGYGERFPVDVNATERGRARNRRVEIVFSDDKGRLGVPREVDEGARRAE
ncbi:OmpA family protein [uncultured Pseudomonas sp.]|uniref:OmpA family protein n=1 Tax=uncultured Pseudomonas sp. TaxID=114707 RepID=UPI0025E46A05|nr:OmpA family protein [uncultured Pseudomonas sp.]